MRSKPSFASSFLALLIRRTVRGRMDTSPESPGLVVKRPATPPVSCAPGRPRRHVSMQKPGTGRREATRLLPRQAQDRRLPRRECRQREKPGQQVSMGGAVTRELITRAPDTGPLTSSRLTPVRPELRLELRPGPDTCGRRRVLRELPIRPWCRPRSSSAPPPLCRRRRTAEQPASTMPSAHQSTLSDIYSAPRPALIGACCEIEITHSRKQAIWSTKSIRGLAR
jgi:hypothetical protein